MPVATLSGPPRADSERGRPIDDGLPKALSSVVEELLDARDDPERLRAIFDDAELPMVVFDDERRYLDANTPARLLFRTSLEELRALRIEDLAPPGALADPERVLDDLIAKGYATGRYEMGFEDGSRLMIVFWTLAYGLSGAHVSVFAPAGWPERELVPKSRSDDEAPALTRRELEILRLAAQGASGPDIASELVISPTTVKTHFANIYAKLGVTDRAAAVASALRRGLIE